MVTTLILSIIILYLIIVIGMVMMAEIKFNNLINYRESWDLFILLCPVIHLVLLYFMIVSKKNK